MSIFINPWSKDNSIWYQNEWDIRNTIFSYGTTNNASNNQENVSRPTWQDVYDGYPKTTDESDDLPSNEVFKLILGENYNADIFTNACATRVSLGLLNGGIEVKKEYIIQKGEFKGKGFIASAVNLKNWLTETWGEADIIIEKPNENEERNIDDVKEKIGSKNGIYIIIGGFCCGISGHATLWIGENQDTVGGHNYANYEGTIYFWELE